MQEERISRLPEMLYIASHQAGTGQLSLLTLLQPLSRKSSAARQRRRFRAGMQLQLEKVWMKLSRQRGQQQLW